MDQPQERDTFAVEECMIVGTMREKVPGRVGEGSHRAQRRGRSRAASSDLGPRQAVRAVRLRRCSPGRRDRLLKALPGPVSARDRKSVV